MPIIKTENGNLAYSRTGDGTPLVLLHANPGDRRDWDGVIEALTREHTVIAFDWPGYGESPPPAPPSSASAESFATLLAASLEQLALGPAILVGNSVGGYAAMHVAHRHPHLVGALVLVDSAGFTEHTWLTRTFTRLKGTEWLTRRIAGRFSRRYLVRRTPWTQAMIARADAETRDPVQVAVDAAVWRSFLTDDIDFRERAATLAVPTLLVWGRRDPNVPLARDGANARLALPNAPFVVLDTGHAPQAEDPDAFLAALVPFLRQHAKRANTEAPSISAG